MCLEPQPVYLDCAATTPIEPEVMETMTYHMGHEFGNPASQMHSFGQRARSSVEKARNQIANVVSAKRSEVIFTSGATESNNLAILGLADEGRKTNRKHIITTQIEHQSVLSPMNQLANAGFEVDYLPVENHGQVNPELFSTILRPDTLLVSIMQINNETGVRQPISEITELLKDHPAYFHVDGAQGFGKELSVLSLPRIDLISISGHKIYGPPGIGALIARRRGKERPPLNPLIHGGGQELGYRSGSLPVHLIAGFGKASELAVTQAEQREKKCREFKAHLLDALSPLDFQINGIPEHIVANIINLRIGEINAEILIDALLDYVAISDGAACSSASTVCSHVLSSMGLSSKQIEASVRLSWCHFTPEPNWGIIVDVIQKLETIS